MKKNSPFLKNQPIREQLSHEFLMLAPEALDALRDMIHDPDINPIARVQAIGLIMDRGLGKPEECIRIEDSKISSEEARKRLEAIAARIRAEVDGESDNASSCSSPD